MALGGKFDPKKWLSGLWDRLRGKKASEDIGPPEDAMPMPYVAGPSPDAIVPDIAPAPDVTPPPIAPDSVEPEMSIPNIAPAPDVTPPPEPSMPDPEAEPSMPDIAPAPDVTPPPEPGLSDLAAGSEQPSEPPVPEPEPSMPDIVPAPDVTPPPEPGLADLAAEPEPAPEPSAPGPEPSMPDVAPAPDVTPPPEPSMPDVAPAPDVTPPPEPSMPDIAPAPPEPGLSDLAAGSESPPEPPVPEPEPSMPDGVSAPDVTPPPEPGPFALPDIAPRPPEPVSQEQEYSESPEPPAPVPAESGPFALPDIAPQPPEPEPAVPEPEPPVEESPAPAEPPVPEPEPPAPQPEPSMPDAAAPAESPAPSAAGDEDPAEMVRFLLAKVDRLEGELEAERDRAARARESFVEQQAAIGAEAERDGGPEVTVPAENAARELKDMMPSLQARLSALRSAGAALDAEGAGKAGKALVSLVSSLLDLMPVVMATAAAATRMNDRLRLQVIGLGDSLKFVTRQLADFGTSTEKAQRDMLGRSGDLALKTEEFTRRVERMAEAEEELIKMVVSLREHAGDLRARIDASAGKSEASAQLLAQRFEELSRTAESAWEAIRDDSRVQTTRAREAADKLRLDIRQLIEGSIREVTGGFAEQAKSFSATAESQSQAVKDLLMAERQLGGWIKDIGKRLDDLVARDTQHSRELGELRRMIDDLSRKLNR